LDAMPSYGILMMDNIFPITHSIVHSLLAMIAHKSFTHSVIYFFIINYYIIIIIIALNLQIPRVVEGWT